MLDNLLKDLFSNDDLVLEKSKNLSRFSTMKLLAVGDLITVKNVEALKKLLSILNLNKINYRVIGWGANLLLPEKSSVPYIQLDFSYDKNIFEKVQDEYVLPASVSLATLTSHANRFGLKGWEVFTGIPSTLGGALVMNAGTNLGEIGSVVKEVYIITKDGREKLIKIDKNSFSYRKNNFIDIGDIIYQARLFHLGIDNSISIKIKDYLDMRTRTQPLKEATCGCVFKNYQNKDTGLTCRAGFFIDIMGLKGFTYKNLQVSPKHANFMENKGDSTYNDVITMIDIIKKELKLQYGVSFETEVEY